MTFTEDFFLKAFFNGLYVEIIEFSPVFQIFLFIYNIPFLQMYNGNMFLLCVSIEIYNENVFSLCICK